MTDRFNDGWDDRKEEIVEPDDSDDHNFHGYKVGKSNETVKPYEIPKPPPGRGTKKFCYTYVDLSELSGIAVNTLRVWCKRSKYDFDNAISFGDFINDHCRKQ